MANMFGNIKNNPMLNMLKMAQNPQQAVMNMFQQRMGNNPMMQYVFQLAQSNNTILLKTTGIKDIKANVVFTPTAAGTITLSLYANGTAISGAVYTETVADSGTATFIINDAVKVVNNLSGDVANISLQLDVAGTLVDGAVIVEHLS